MRAPSNGVTAQNEAGTDLGRRGPAGRGTDAFPSPEGRGDQWGGQEEPG